MFVKSTLTALAFALAAPAAFAGNVSAGEAQLAKLLNVEPGQYTLAELIRLDDAVRANDLVEVQVILDRATENNGLSTRNAPSAGVAQLAAIEGVNASDYSVSQLIRLSDAQRANDLVLVAQIKAENNDSPYAGVSAGRAQIAANLGVNPADYTLAELVAMDESADPH